ncbi:DNA repair protein MmcB-like [Rhabdaerophilaceae bacterium]
MRESVAPLLARGLTRHLVQRDWIALPEMPLPNGRRADLMALSRKGALWIIEIKSSIEDFRSDQKWREYLPFCDGFFFATHAAVPLSTFPAETGLFLADGFDAELLRPAPLLMPIPPATRKALTIQMAFGGARRWLAATDPDALRPDQ